MQTRAVLETDQIAGSKEGPWQSVAAWSRSLHSPPTATAVPPRDAGDRPTKAVSRERRSMHRCPACGSEDTKKHAAAIGNRMVVFHPRKCNECGHEFDPAPPKSLGTFVFVAGIVGCCVVAMVAVVACVRRFSGAADQGTFLAFLSGLGVASGLCAWAIRMGRAMQQGRFSNNADDYKKKK